MHKTENKSLWKDEMTYGSDTWYMGRTYGELKNYACVWLISICIIKGYFWTEFYLRVQFGAKNCVKFLFWVFNSQLG